MSSHVAIVWLAKLQQPLRAGLETLVTELHKEKQITSIFMI